MKNHFQVFLTLLLAFFVFSPVHAQNTPPPARSVILLIGDGMGVAQVEMAERYAREFLGKDLALNTFPYQASTTTASANSEVTDSAAGVTAILSGQKVNNAMINILPDGQFTYPITQAARDAGKAVGVVTTTRLTHATPAGVYAYSPEREDESLIAEQFVQFAPEVALGGGRAIFLPSEMDGGAREDERNLIEELQGSGYTYIDTVSGLASIDIPATQKLLGLFSSSHMYFEIDQANGDYNMPSLSVMTDTALRILEKDPDGFFLMVEGGRIDHAAHEYDPATMVLETMAFDNAVQIALDYQAQHPDVLVIVTADHETGGLDASQANLAPLWSIRCSLAFLDWQIEENPDTALETVSQCGYNLTDEQKTEFYRFDPAEAPENIEGAPEAYIGAPTWAHAVLALSLSTEMNITWSTSQHTSQNITTYAAGPGAEMLGDLIDNTQVALLMEQALGVHLHSLTPVG